jgi:AraC-like DNA-binding protein
MATEPRCMAVAAKLAAKKLKNVGADVDQILGKAGLTQRAVNREGAWISEDSMGQLLDLCAEELGDPHFGLHLGEQGDPRDYGPIAYIGISSETLGDAIRNLQRYLHTVTEGWKIELSVDDENAVIEYLPTIPRFQNYRQLVEGSASSIMIAYQTFLGRPLQPKEVHFVHSRNGSQKEYKTILGCPVKFQQNHNRIVLDRNDLALPIKTADDKLLKILKDLCKKTYEKRTSKASALVSRINKVAIDFIPQGKGRTKDIAAEIGVSERTLHRHLLAEGHSITGILDGLKKDFALQYIKQRELNLVQVAFLLGYADHSSFSTAFKRWTGKTPREARQ